MNILDSYKDLLNDIYFKDEETAQKVYVWMRATKNTFGFASIADLLKMIGRTANEGDQFYGWSDLEKAKVMKHSNKVYSIEWPELEVIEDEFYTNHEKWKADHGLGVVERAIQNDIYNETNKAFEKQKDGFNVISKPAHYTQGRKYEPRKVIIDWGLGFYLGNTVKYISRAGRKGSAIEDLEKAAQYLQWEIERLKEKEEKKNDEA